ncbi:MAG TPA: RNA polymerase sigma-70 factor [Sphingobacterium sp.]|nr:RNA polymerase sigma-70 factor [Sphingobacterium sp.]
MQDYSGYSNEELIRSIRASELGAFNELYNRYAEGLILYVYNKLGDLEESKDIVQEIFVNIWTDRENILIYRSVSGYLYKIALNKSLNLFRKQKIEEKYINSLADYLEIGTTTTQEQQFAEIENEKLVNEAIDRLPEKMREVFALRYFKGMSNQEVAEKLKISSHTVATQMKRALKEIRKTTSFVLFITILINL